ncbi:hypothetical protein NE865_12176 [Phthorimaea operculella]|nr:hypothetical protein NE865_12176 [Phthorimaea operculella]
MEDVYTIKVKTKPDTRNLYPSERRYSASTVSGLAWVHIALAATSFLLACLALVNPNSSTDIKRLTLNDTEEKLVDRSELIFNLSEFETTTESNVLSDNFTVNNDDEKYNEEKDEAGEGNKKIDNNYILVLAPTLLTIFALAAGIASIMASVRWYIDRNITWLFFVSILSSIFAFVSVIMIIVWLTTTGGETSGIQNENLNSKDFIVVKTSDVIHKNESHIIIKNSSASEQNDDSSFFNKRVLSINILIASVLELLWSILSVKIAYKGMRNNYKEDNDRRGNCISVVTTIKGNTNKLPRNAKLIPPKPDLIEHYPSTKIKRIFLAQSDNGFYLKNQNNKAKNTETSSEFYKERMMNFLNRCASQANHSEMRTPSEIESVLNVIPEVTNVEAVVENEPATPTPAKDNSRITPVSWGDTPEHTVYNQNTLDLDKIFNFKKGERKTNDPEDFVKIHNHEENSDSNKTNETS